MGLLTFITSRVLRDPIRHEGDWKGNPTLAATIPGEPGARRDG